MGVSENRLNPIVPNGFADHYPYEKWLFHWEYSLFSDKPISSYLHIFVWGISVTIVTTKNYKDPSDSMTL